jgi:Cu/Ag efflux pump CusA
MAVNALRTEFELMTRGPHTKVDCEIGVKVNGRELPNLAVLGEALEKAVETVQAIVTESYNKVPERVTV